MAISFIIGIFITKALVISPELYGLMLVSAILTLIGFWDDIREIYWKMQLFFQIAASFFMFIVGIRIYYVTNPFTGGVLNMESGVWVILSVALVIFWSIMVINAINWLDGIDGLSGGVAIISALAILFLSLKGEVNQPPVAIICSIFIGSVLAFLVLNFNPARIFAGTSGSNFMGFVIAALAVFSGTKIATAILVMIIPITDFVWVIGERIRYKRSIFIPDNNHLHHKLLELGWSQRKITSWYWAVTLAAGIIALNTRAIGKGVTIVGAAVIIVAVLVVVNKKIADQKKYAHASKI